MTKPPVTDLAIFTARLVQLQADVLVAERPLGDLAYVAMEDARRPRDRFLGDRAEAILALIEAAGRVSAEAPYHWSSPRLLGGIRAVQDALEALSRPTPGSGE